MWTRWACSCVSGWPRSGIAIPTSSTRLRGEGLLSGVRTHVPNADLVAAMREQKLLGIPAGDNVVRLIPPLIITESEIREAVARLDAACTVLEAGMSAMKQAGGVQ